MIVRRRLQDAKSWMIKTCMRIEFQRGVWCAVCIYSGGIVGVRADGLRIESCIQLYVCI